MIRFPHGESHSQHLIIERSFTPRAVIMVCRICDLDCKVLQFIKFERKIWKSLSAICLLSISVMIFGQKLNRVLMKYVRNN